LKEHILIIEPNTIELRKLREVFSQEGFNIMTATDIQTAKDIIEKINIKYVISDISTFNELKLSVSNKKNP